MRVIFVGDAGCSTGFAGITHTVCDALHAAGHEVHVLGINYYGETGTLNSRYPYPIYLCSHPFDGGRNVMGETRLPILIDRLRPDVVVLLNDTWNIAAYLHCIREYIKHVSCDFICPPIIPWLAVDAKNQKAAILNDSLISHVAVWTEFAAKELSAGGYSGDCSVIPLGVDTSIFYPRDRTLCRRSRGWPDNAFVVGVVGRNQPRKRLDLTIEYFAHWIQTCCIDNAYLLLHVAPTGENGVDLESLVRYHGIGDRVIISHPEMNMGYGADESLMPEIYSMMDVYLTTTQGEGWGMPATESMACGVPTIGPDFAAFGPDGWTEGCMYTVECTASATTAPMNSKMWTVGGVMDKQQTVQRLDAVYRSGRLQMAVNNGLDIASRLPWSNTSTLFISMLEGVVRRRAEERTMAETDEAEAVAETVAEYAEYVDAEHAQSSDFASAMAFHPKSTG